MSPEEYAAERRSFNELATKTAARDVVDAARAAQIPATPEAYELKLAENMPLPAGTTYQFDAKDPGLIAAKAWAHSKGLPQSDFSEMISLYASHVAQQDAALAARSQEEIAKAGPNAPQRMDNIRKWVTGTVGEKDAAPINATIVTDAHLRFFENIITKITNQGGASFSQQHRAAPESAAIPGFEKMSFAQQRLAQDQLRARKTA